MSFTENIDGVKLWSMSACATIDNPNEDLKSLWQPLKEIETIYTAILVLRTKIKGKQYARPFIWNRSITGKARIEQIANKIDNGNYEFSLNLTGIGEPKEE